MNAKEIGEIRRRTRRGYSNMTALYGCFVNNNKEVISLFRQSLGTMPENEAEQFFKHFSKSLSGTMGKNLIDIAFSTQQVTDSPEHKLLMELCQTELKDESILLCFYDKIVQSLNLETSYLILVGCDTYDIPLKNCDALENGEDCINGVYCYIVCCICPVKDSKPSIEYKPPVKEFHNSAIMQLLTQPVMGFLFPAFDDRQANIYNALFYTKDSAATHEEFIKAVFNTCQFVPAAQQKETFDILLSDALEEECTLPVVQAVRQDLDARIHLHKESKSNEPLTVGKEDIKDVLTSAGVSEDKISAFNVGFDQFFGEDAMISPKNIIDQRKFEVKTTDATLRINPGSIDCIETRIIDGTPYVLIPAEDLIVDGVKVYATKN